MLLSEQFLALVFTIFFLYSLEEHSKQITTLTFIFATPSKHISQSAKKTCSEKNMDNGGEWRNWYFFSVIT